MEILTWNVSHQIPYAKYYLCAIFHSVFMVYFMNCLFFVTAHKMFSVVDLKTWGIVVSKGDAKGVDNLVQTMTKVADDLGINIALQR